MSFDMQHVEQFIEEEKMLKCSKGGKKDGKSKNQNQIKSI
jgi:hypothetical protein